VYLFIAGINTGSEGFIGYGFNLLLAFYLFSLL